MYQLDGSTCVGHEHRQLYFWGDLVDVNLVPKSEYHAIAAFIDQYWARDHIYCRSRSLFDWTFADNPSWQGEGYSFATARVGNEIVGILGAIPFALNLFGETRPACWLANWMVAPSARATAAGLRLIRVFTDDLEWNAFSLGINEPVTPLYRAMRWELVTDWPRWVMSGPGQRNQCSDLLRQCHPDWADTRIRALSDRLGESTEMGVISGNIGRSLSREWDSRGWAHISSEMSGATRDFDYLSWRYQDHPTFDYEFLTISDGERQGLMVWRKQDIVSDISGGGAEVISRVARIVEFLPCSENNARSLIGFLESWMSEYNIVFADCYMQHKYYCEWLSQGGFERIDNVTDGEHFPSRFSPLDGKSGNIRSAIKLAPDTLGEMKSRPESWYWTKSDADQDRPN